MVIFFLKKNKLCVILNLSKIQKGVLMKISNETLSILKSFSSINPVTYLGVDKNSIQVVRKDKSLIGVYQTAEDFTTECAFWNMPQLLSVIDSMGGNNAEIEFDDRFIKVVNADNIHVKYLYTNEAIIIKNNPKPVGFTRYNRDFNKDDKYFEFEISKDILDKLLKLSKILELEVITFNFENGVGTAKLQKTSEDGEGHNFNVELKGEGSGSISINLENLNIILGDYKVMIEKGIVSKWVNKNIPLFYLIGSKANVRG